MGRAPYIAKWFWLFALLLPVLPLSGIADGEITPEQVKAVYLVQIRKFVQVDTPPHPIREICYYEKSGVPESESVGQILTKYLQKNKAPGDSVTVRSFQAIRDFTGCDMMFIPADEEANIDNILAKLGSAPVLTVSPAKRFIFHGGMIGMNIDDSNRVRLEGNIKNMNASNVLADAQLLEIMEQVVRQ